MVLGLVGQRSFYEPAQISLVWPLSGLSLLWLMGSSRTQLGWDSLLLGVASGSSVLLGVGGWDRTVFGVVLTLVPTWCMLAVLHRLGWQDAGAPGRQRPLRLVDLVPLGVCVAVGGTASAALRMWGLGLLDPSGLNNGLLTGVRTVAWTVVPLAVVLTATRGARRASPDTPSTSPALRSAEWAVLVVLTAAFMWWVFMSPDPLPVLYPAFLVAVWSALRTSTARAAALSAVVGLVGIGFTLAGRGPFVAVTDPRTGAALSQGFMVCLCLVALVISLALSDRREAAEVAAQSTALAQSRADLLDAVIANITEGIVVVQDDDQAVLRNEASLRLVPPPAASTNAPTGPSPVFLLWSSDGAPLTPWQLPSRVVLDGGEHQVQDLYVRQTGELRRTLEVSATRLPRSGDHPPQAVVTFRDVSEERSQRSELEAFAGVVAHDLANPLTVISGWSEALEHDATTTDLLPAPDVLAITRRIMAASTHMNTFISDLLNLTMTRNQPLSAEAVDFTALCRNVAVLRVETNPTAQVDVQPDLQVHGDVRMLRQLVDNLVGNAFKYVAPEVDPHVRITATSTSAGIEVRVQDNGIGIPVDDRPHVFGDFFRVDAARGQYQGTGLGLAICSRVVLRHGG